MLDLKEVTEDYSVYDYQKDARKAIKDITSRGKRVIIVGGTGLYIKAALYDYRFPTQEKKNNYDNYSLEELVEKINAYSGNDKDIIILANKFQKTLENNMIKKALTFNA